MVMNVRREQSGELSSTNCTLRRLYHSRSLDLEGWARLGSENSDATVEQMMCRVDYMITRGCSRR